MLAVALLVLTTTGYVGLGSILAGISLLPAAVWLAPAAHRSTWLVAAAAVAAFILYTHRGNLRRMRAGTEHRFERARILRRLFSKS
jgi:glycerol-3-phosphate acyltransferase PlsY